MVAATITLLRRELPGTAYGRGTKAKAVVHSALRRMVSKRRNDLSKGLLSDLIRASEEANNPISNEDIVRQLAFILMAGHDTTSSALSTVLYYLAKHPEWQDRARENIASIPAPLSFEDLAKLDAIDLVFREAVRLHPLVPIIPRRAVEACTLASYDISANTNVTLNTGFTHIIKEWWERPLSFEPDRFAAPRNEHRQHGFLWVPFGACAHKCLGINFAQIEIKVFLYHFLRRFSVGLCPGRSYRIRTLPIPKPSEDLRLVLKRAQLRVGKRSCIFATSDTGGYVKFSARSGHILYSRPRALSSRNIAEKLARA